jgi:predicted acetyltransferase
MHLVEPNEDLREGFLVGVREWAVSGVGCGDGDGGFWGVQGLRDRTRREMLPTHLVPETYLWLVDAGEFIGRVSIRHELNEALRTVGGHVGYEIRPSKRRQGYGTRILALALERAKALGLREVLVTCDADNVGSRRIIEQNGGRLENQIEAPGARVPKLRFWISIPDEAERQS